METITRIGSFDSMHRVMNEKFKCFNVHGHTYIYHLEIGYLERKDIGYAVDFKEVKRVLMQYVDDRLDHAAILNPKDHEMIEVCKKLNSKMWLMSLSGTEYCNPTAENIAIELFLALDYMVKRMGSDLFIASIKLYETPNCYVTVSSKDDIKFFEATDFYCHHIEELNSYLSSKGTIEYDDRK